MFILSIFGSFFVTVMFVICRRISGYSFIACVAKIDVLVLGRTRSLVVFIGYDDENIFIFETKVASVSSIQDGKLINRRINLIAIVKNPRL